MINLREYRQNPDRLSDLLPWAALVAPEVCLNKDGSFQTTVKYRGPDLDSATESELISVAARLNNILKRLGSGWAIYVEAQRRLSQEYPVSEWNNAIGFLIDEERRLFFQEQNHFESHYYFTLIYLPPPDSQNRISSAFIERAVSDHIDYSKLLKTFQHEVTRIVQLMETIFPEVSTLEGDALLTYLHSLVSDKLHPVRTPETPMYLDAILADTALLPGFAPTLGKFHLRTISVIAFPGKSQPGLLDVLNRLSIEYRWVTRFICLDKTGATSELNSYKRRWFAKRKGILTLLKEVFTNSESIMGDSDAVNKAMDTDAALEELADDAVSYGFFTTTIVIWSTDPQVVSAKSAEIERAINSLGFTTKLEDVNAIDAWLGSIPGNCRNNVRRPILNTLNLSHLIPLSAVWAGPEKNEHLNAPPLVHAVTNGSTPFRLITHVGDVGHTLILGPSGAGKSVLLNLMEVQFLRYQQAQVYIFDKGGSARTITAGVGGDHYDLGGDNTSLAFQPLRHIDNESERRWAHEWTLEIVAQENVPITPHIKEDLWKALSSLATAHPDERTVFGLTVVLQNDLLRRALLPYTVQGAHGRLLDNATDNLEYARWQCFEMEVLMETPSVLVPVLSYLFHRLEQRFKGNPTMLILDEAWLYLDNPMFTAKIREWLKVLRKANVMVVFATQSLADIDQSSIAATIKETCFTKIYLPNATALNEDTARFYKRFGLNEKQIEILALATPKQEYYYTSPLGNRLFELGLGEIARCYCAATSKEAQATVKKLEKEKLDHFSLNEALLEEAGLFLAQEALRFLNNRRSAA
jgi:type IV secretion/conjugal transfer VirB4 family ATPase